MTRPLRQLGFLTIGLFDPADPRPGHESVLRIIELGEQLGFDSAWVRSRHLQAGISSPLTVLAAASQRTSRIRLGTAVIPLGLENPFRLAEDLATVDVLSGGRLEAGVSVGVPMNYEHLKHGLYPDTHDVEDFTYERIARLLRAVRGEPVSDFEGTVGIETFHRGIQPHVPDLAARIWHGVGSIGSATWAGSQGLNLLASSVVRAEDESPDVGFDFDAIQRRQIDAFRAHHPRGERARVSIGPVIIPTDSATSAQIERYEAYVASRSARVGVPQGPDRLLFAQDLLGTSEQLAERLAGLASFQAVDELVVALPFTFEHEDYVQILEDLAMKLAPLLGWTPGLTPPAAPGR